MKDPERTPADLKTLANAELLTLLDAAEGGTLDASALLQEMIDRAWSRAGIGLLILPSGTYRATPLSVPPGIRLVKRDQP